MNKRKNNYLTVILLLFKFYKVINVNLVKQRTKEKKNNVNYTGQGRKHKNRDFLYLFKLNPGMTFLNTHFSE